MSLQKLQFRPGFNKERTSYSNEGGWEDGNKVRFRRGDPESIGGWQKYLDSSFLGACRALLPWVSLDGARRIGIGTNVKYYVEEGGQLLDITPIRSTTAAGDVTFSASTGSATLTVSDTGHGAQLGDYVTFSGAVSLGGDITADVLNQEYRIDNVIDIDTYTVTARTAGTSISSITVDGELSYTEVPATASDTGAGGSATVGAYQIYVSPDNTTIGTGWGTGYWGRGSWGSGSSTTIEASQLSAWSHDAFGEDILICRRGGPIYLWDTSVGASTRAVDIASLSGSEIPVAANRILVSDRDRHVIALGVNPEGTSTAADLDPMLIRFSETESYTIWNTSETTTAGDLRLGSGSEIVTGIETRQQTLVFTDTALYAMQYVGDPFTFGVTLVSNNTSILSPTAAVAVDDRVFWVGDHAFYRFDGAVTELRCDVLDHVFDTMDSGETTKVTCGSNVQFSEVWWFYPCSTSSECDRYVVYNYAEDIWYTGTLPRSAWVDSADGQLPVAASHIDHYLYYHEFGLNDGSTDPASGIHAYIESSPLDIGDGEQFTFISRMLPDIDFKASTLNGASVDITTSVRNAVNGDYVDSYVNTVTADTEISYLRLRGRQFSVKAESNDAGVEWRFGAQRYDTRTDGKR